MSKRRTRWFCAVLAAAMLMTTPELSFAASWKNDVRGWWYEEDDGSYPAEDFRKVGEKWYYFDETGYMVTGWRQCGGKYYFDESGAMVTDWRLLGGKWYYFDGSGAMVTEWKLLGGKWYYFEESGAMAQSRWIDGMYYVGTDGVMLQNTITPDGYRVGEDGAYIKARIELSDYLLDGDVSRVAADVGNMAAGSSDEYKRYASGQGLFIGIQADKPSQSGDGTNVVYYQITDIYNTGNKEAALFGIFLGDSFEDIQRAFKNGWNVGKPDVYNGTAMFCYGDGDLFKAKMVNGRIVSYSYHVRYTG